jgi:endonuclease/exonuclease/phosphatase family metal-dependent hydrolase
MPRRLLLPFALVLLLAAAPMAEAKPGPKLTVMTRNIFLGGNIALPIGATSREDFEAKTTQLWQQVQATDFPARAKLLAREVRKTKPDVIGLQEVALWRRGPDGVKDGAATPSTTKVYDFLATLRAELGKGYRLGNVQTEADIEAPTNLGYDVRLTMRDAVLVRKRKGLKIRRKLGGNYTATFEVPTQIGTLSSRRGWTAIDGSLRGKRFRFVDTHLEAFDDTTRLAQARALAAGPLRKSGTVIFVGDINSDPTGATGAKPEAYNVFTGAGLRDTWLLRNKKGTGNNCCLKGELIDDPPPGPFDHRVDHIFAKGRFKVLRTRIVGTDPANRTAGGLWPSDHGGGATTLRLR